MVVRNASGWLNHVLPTCLLCACAASFDPMDGAAPESFCTFDNGYRIGADGSDYIDHCPAVLAPAFADGYEAGFTIHLAQLEIEAMERAIEAVSMQLQQNWRDTADVAAKLNQAVDDSDRRELQHEATALTAQQDALTRQLDELELDVASRKSRLLGDPDFIASNH
jgi:hypothetical protein